MRRRCGRGPISGAGGRLQLSSLDEARRVPTILVVRSFFTHQFLQAQGFTNLHTVSRPEDMLRMLVNDRALLMFANKLTVPELAAQQGVPLADLVPLRSVLHWTSTSPSRRARRRRRWRAGPRRWPRCGATARWRAS